MTLYICLMVAVVLSDQLLKFYIQQNVPLNVSYEVIPGVLSIGTCEILERLGACG